MADNVNIPSSGSVQVATKDIGGIQYTKVIPYDSSGVAALGNSEGTLIADGSRTGAQTATLTNPNARGIILDFDVSTRPGTDTIGIDIRDGNGFGIAFFSPLSVDTTLVCYPGAATGGAALPGSANVASMPVPRSITVIVTPSNLGATWQYALKYSLIV